MSEDREAIFSAIRTALEPLGKERAPYPQWDERQVRSHNPSALCGWPRFSQKLNAVHGTPLEGLDALGEYLKKEGLTIGYCDPMFVHVFTSHPAFEGLHFETDFDRRQVDRYQFGITRASGAIAETGTIILKDGETSSRLGALAPWVHIALLHPSRLMEYVSEATADFGDDPSVIWVTGPSKTADVEGILIEGVHGPGKQICCLCDI